MRFPIDRLVLVPDDIDLARSPLAGRLAAETYVLGVFNPGLTRLPSGNLLMMVRVAEALQRPVHDGYVHAIRWDRGRYACDAWALDLSDTVDPRGFIVQREPWRVLALTSLSWLLPVELSPDGLERVAIHYDRALAPENSLQCYGVEDPRISRVDGRWLMTTCSVSPERQSTTLYTSSNGLDWNFADIILDHQNKDMVIFEGLIRGSFWAQTRPLGDHFFAYPPGSEWRAGPSINLATSPDALHWKPCMEPGLRPRAGAVAPVRIGAGSPPIRLDEGWLSLWHGVEPNETVGIYRTYWSLLAHENPSKVLRASPHALLNAEPSLTGAIAHQMYVRDVVFTTGAVLAGDHLIVASGESDLACRITHVPLQEFAGH